MIGALIFLAVMTTWMSLTAAAAYKHNKSYDERRASCIR